MSSRRGSAVLEVPEENYASETALPPEPGVHEPAPAGALQREAAGAFAAIPPLTAVPSEEDEYIPQRSASNWRMRLRGGIPRSITGRIVAGSSVALMFGVLGLVALGSVRYLQHDDRFAVATSSEIEIQGNEHLTRGQILSVFGADLERNIFKVPLAERRVDLERLPWVAHATVMRLLPNHIRIAITERTPVAFVRQGTELGLVDASGVLLDMPAESAGDPHYSFPVLTGLNASDPLTTRAARMAVYAKFMKELDSTGEKFSHSLSEVDVSNPEDVKALVASGGIDVLVHFGDEQFLDRYRAFQQHLPEWKSQYPHLASADMRYERQVVLEMTPGSAVPVNDAPAASAAPAAPAPASSARPRMVAAPPAAHGAPNRKAPAKSGKQVLAHQKMAAKIAAARSAHLAKSVPAQQGAR